MLGLWSGARGGEQCRPWRAFHHGEAPFVSSSSPLLLPTSCCSFPARGYWFPFLCPHGSHCPRPFCQSISLCPHLWSLCSNLAQNTRKPHPINPPWDAPSFALASQCDLVSSVFFLIGEFSSVKGRILSLWKIFCTLSQSGACLLQQYEPSILQEAVSLVLIIDE